MKIICLNTWGGRAGREQLLAFFEENKANTDIFCLQEVWSAPYEFLEGKEAGGRKIDHSEIMTSALQELSTVLDSHAGYFRPHYLDNYGLLLFVKKDISIIDEGELFVHKEKDFNPLSIENGEIGMHARNIQWVTVQKGGAPVTIINFHGLWNGKGKTDSEERLAQSEKILSFIKTVPGKVLLCGDFNLLPDTQSLKMFEEFGLRNLIAEYGITSTRTAHYDKPAKFADYAFVSKGVEILDFKVLPDEVSDHSPLYLEIALR
jgi:endonuclease/exonuclease/phosphatase family metal-dependent hydrolase